MALNTILNNANTDLPASSQVRSFCLLFVSLVHVGMEPLQQRKDRAAHGFKRGRSIITNAQQHRHRRWVFNFDLEDFFPSINFGRVRCFFLKNRDFGLQGRIATVMAQIACHDRHKRLVI